MRDDLDARHQAAELEQRARHVIGGGDQPQRGEALVLHPGGGLHGVAAGVVGFIAEHHAAGQVFRRVLREVEQLAHVDAAVDA